MIEFWVRSVLSLCLAEEYVEFILGLWVWERDERRPPPQILSFLPPSLHSKSMTSGVSGGRDQPIGAELRTERSLSPFCSSGQSTTKEDRCLIPMRLPEPRRVGVATAPGVPRHCRGCSIPASGAARRGQLSAVRRRTLIKPQGRVVALLTPYSLRIIL